MVSIIRANRATADTTPARIFYTNADEDAIAYFLERVEAVECITPDSIAEENRVYIISGKAEGKHRIVIVAFIWIVLIGFAFYGMPPAVYVSTVVLAFGSVLYAIVRYCTYQIRIEREGFVCRTNPFNGKYYPYSKITDCKVIRKKRKASGLLRRGIRPTRYVYYFSFMDKAGVERQIQFEKSLFELEINILMNRIKQA